MLLEMFVVLVPIDVVLLPIDVALVPIDVMLLEMFVLLVVTTLILVPEPIEAPLPSSTRISPAGSAMTDSVIANVERPTADATTRALNKPLRAKGKLTGFPGSVAEVSSAVADASPSILPTAPL
jgi:hypothetical protein